MDTASQLPLPKADPSWRIGIVHSLFYGDLTGHMVEEAKAALMEAGIPADNIEVHGCPGSFEIPLIGSELAESGTVDGLLALGIVVQGETHHARLVAEQAARGVMDVQLRSGMPFAFEILFVNDLATAKARVTARPGKGRAAAIATLQSLSKLQAIRA